MQGDGEFAEGSQSLGLEPANGMINKIYITEQVRIGTLIALL